MGSTRRPLTWGFRGSIAPASLKAPLAGPDDPPAFAFPGLYCPGLIEGPARPPWPAGAGWFPGLYCPGLIEGSRPQRPAQGGEGGFRGSIAPASLKEWHLPRRLRPRHRFRGSIAPASLKDGYGRAGLRGPGGFPGLYCPGLIEGGGVYCSTRRRARVSGALLPRPH